VAVAQQSATSFRRSFGLTSPSCADLCLSENSGLGSHARHSGGVGAASAEFSDRHLFGRHLRSPAISLAGLGEAAHRGAGRNLVLR
jgi:hypothetical protein